MTTATGAEPGCQQLRNGKLWPDIAPFPHWSLIGFSASMINVWGET